MKNQMMMLKKRKRRRRRKKRKKKRKKKRRKNKCIGKCNQHCKKAPNNKPCDIQSFS